MKSNYFPHDFNARNDENILKMFQCEGLEGAGLFWFLIEMLYEAGGWLKMDCEDLCFNMRLQNSKIPLIKRVIEKYHLFEIKENQFTSPRVLQTLNYIKERSKKAKKSAEIRWDKDADKKAKGMPTHSEGIAIKQDKSKQEHTKQEKNKQNEIKEDILIPKPKPIKSTPAEVKTSASAIFFKAVMTYYISKFKEKFNNEEPAIAFGKDNIIVGRARDLFKNDTWKQLIDWFLESEKASEFGYSLSICFSTHTINNYKTENKGKYAGLED